MKVFCIFLIIFIQDSKEKIGIIHGHHFRHEKMAESGIYFFIFLSIFFQFLPFFFFLNLLVRFLPGTQVVEIRYEDLLDETKDLGASIKAAYGFDGLGILVVSGVPGIEEKRAKTLPLAQK